MNKQFIKAVYEEKFIVVNKKHLKNVPNDVLESFQRAHYELLKFIPDNKYYVCNQDESYADKIIDIILKNESNKAN